MRAGVARVEFRDAAGRMLGWADRQGDTWSVETADGRHTTVDTRIDALVSGAAMADAVSLPAEGGEPDA